MTEPIKKEDANERFNKIETTLIAIVEDLKEARKERQNLEKRINETVRKIKEVIKEKLGVNLD